MTTNTNAVHVYYEHCGARRATVRSDPDNGDTYEYGATEAEAIDRARRILRDYPTTAASAYTREVARNVLAWCGESEVQP